MFRAWRITDRLSRQSMTGGLWEAVRAEVRRTAETTCIRPASSPASMSLIPIPTVLLMCVQNLSGTGALLSALVKLLTTKQPIGDKDSTLYILVFGIGCLVVAILIAILDIAAKYVRGASFFKMEYEDRGYIVLVFWWSIAAFITGMVGVSLDVLQPTIAGCLGVAISWSLLVSVFTGKDIGDGPLSPTQDNEPGEEP